MKKKVSSSHNYLVNAGSDTKDVKLQSIKMKVFMIFFLITVISIIGNSVFNFRKYEKTIKQQLMSTSNQTVGEIDQGLTRYILSVEQMAKVVADMPDIQKNPEAALKGLVEQYDVIGSAYIASAPQGLVVYPFEEGVEDENDTKQNWFEGAMKEKGTPFLSPVYIDSIKKIPTITLSIALNDHQVLGIDITLKDLANDLSQSKVGKTGYLVVADAAGLVIAHPDEEKVGVDSLAETSLWDAINEGKETFLKEQIDGKSKFTSFCTNETTGWKIIGVMETAELSDVMNEMLKTTIIIVIIIAILLIVISQGLGQWVKMKIKEIIRVFDVVAKGDLTPRLQSKLSIEFYNLTECFNKMLENIAAMMTDTAKASNEVETTAKHFANITEQTNMAVSEVATAINQITVGATNVAQDVMKGTEGMQKMKENVDNVTVHINEVNEITENAQKISNNGLMIVKDLGEKSAKAKEATQGIQDIMTQMTSNASQINSISEVISGITEQTNLLALNASIEAARAGEAGRGFSVVADEIRKLAEESKVSTEKIKEILEQTQQLVTSTNTNITETITVIEAENTAVNETISTFNHILSAVEELMTKSNAIKVLMGDVDESGYFLSGEMSKISEETQETMSATEEVNASIEEISASIESLATGIEGLENLSQNLNNLIKQFKIQ